MRHIHMAYDMSMPYILFGGRVTMAEKWKNVWAQKISNENECKAAAHWPQNIAKAVAV